MQLDHSNLTKTQSRLIPVLLIIITAIIGVYALKITRPVTMPLAFAFFITVLVHPMQDWLEQRLPRWLSLSIVMLVLLAVLALFAGAIELSLELIEPQLPRYADQSPATSTVDSFVVAKLWITSGPDRPGQWNSIPGVSAVDWGRSFCSDSV
jgi:predicted PurR-regulated permease PerM